MKYITLYFTVFIICLCLWLSFGFYAFRHEKMITLEHSLTVTNAIVTNNIAIAPYEVIHLNLTYATNSVRPMTDRELLKVLRRIDIHQLTQQEFIALTNLESEVESSTITISNSSGAVIYVELPTLHDEENMRLRHER